jgi:hypothetical protein
MPHLDNNGYLMLLQYLKKQSLILFPNVVAAHIPLATFKDENILKSLSSLFGRNLKKLGYIPCHLDPHFDVPSALMLSDMFPQLDSVTFHGGGFAEDDRAASAYIRKHTKLRELCWHSRFREGQISEGVWDALARHPGLESLHLWLGYHWTPAEDALVIKDGFPNLRRMQMMLKTNSCTHLLLTATHKLQVQESFLN